MAKGESFIIPKESFLSLPTPSGFYFQPSSFSDDDDGDCRGDGRCRRRFGECIGDGGETKKTGGKTRDGAGDVVALNVRSHDYVGEDRDCTGVARRHSNLSVGHQAVKRDDSNRNCQEKGIPTLRGDRHWRRREK